MFLYSVSYKLGPEITSSSASNAERMTLPNYIYASSFANAEAAALALSMTYWVVEGVQQTSLKVIVAS